MCAKGVVAKVTPGRLSEKGTECTFVVTFALLLPPHRRRRIVAVSPSRPSIAIALRATTKGRKRISFRLRPLRGPLVGRFLFGENARHGLGRQPDRGGGVAAVSVCPRTRAARSASACVQARNCIAAGIEHLARRTNGQASVPDARSADPPPIIARQRSHIGWTSSRSRPTRAGTARGAWCQSCAEWRTWGSCASSAGTWRSGPAPIWDGRRASR